MYLSSKHIGDYEKGTWIIDQDLGFKEMTTCIHHTHQVRGHVLNRHDLASIHLDLLGLMGLYHRRILILGNESPLCRYAHWLLLLLLICHVAFLCMSVNNNGEKLERMK
jgi:hypothetical protein